MLRTLYILTSLCLPILFSACATRSTTSDAAFIPEPGDLLFQDLNCGPLCDAIEAVTDGVDGADFSHVGMVSRSNGDEVLVIEAVSTGVVETALPEFLARSAEPDGSSRVLVGRLKPPHRALIPAALDTAQTFKGLPYDSPYVVDNTAFYCSELIYEAFRQAAGEPVFELAPMTFKDPTTNETFPAWVAYYQSLQHLVPEGEPGLNPGGMSRSDKIQIVHAYGKPTGWSGSPP